ncbi:MAG TPA: hypothetical protein VFH00_11805 [Candidatus Nitrosotalea sp.]|nr:hypothetical protein [Candidatus Nitrosotalea sp.]
MTFPSASPEVIYDLARARFDHQLSAVDSIDAKLAGFFGIGSALLGIIAAVYAIKPDAFKGGGWVVLGLALIVFIVLSTICLAGMRPRKWQTGPVMQEVYNDHIKLADAEIKWRVTSALLRQHELNRSTYDTKVKSAKASPVLLAILAGLMVAAVIHVAIQG